MLQGRIFPGQADERRLPEGQGTGAVRDCDALWYDCAMTTTPDDPNVPSATPEALLHKIGTLWIVFGAMITSLGNDDPNLIDRMLTVLEQTKPIGMFSEDALADAVHFVRGLVKRPS